jgi:GMP synthase-like glutamine amidotransferase
MHIHYFQHDHFEDLGFIGEWAANHNFTTSVTRFDQKPEFPSHDDYDWLVILGGKMGVNDSAEFPWLTEEIAFIKQAIRKGKTVIGICLGSQLIATALGARVYRNTEPEIGFLLLISMLTMIRFSGIFLMS